MALKKSGSEASATINNDHAEAARQQLVMDGEAGEWEVVVADDYTLMLDYDQPFVPEQFDMAQDILGDFLGTHAVYKSRSGNTHVLVSLNSSMGLTQRVAFQAILGSDPKREALHMVSIFKGDKNPILLIMRKDRHDG